MRGRPRFGTRKRFGTLNEEQTCDVGPYPAPADAASVERFKPLLNWPAAAHWAAPAISTVAANGMGCGNWSRRTLSVAGRTHRRESPIGAAQRAIVRAPAPLKLHMGMGSWAHLQSRATFSSVLPRPVPRARPAYSRPNEAVQDRIGAHRRRSDNPEVRFHRLASPAIDRQDILGTRREGDDEIHFRSQPHVAAW